MYPFYVELQCYPNTNGVVTGLPTITSTALGSNANGTFDSDGSGSTRLLAYSSDTGPRDVLNSIAGDFAEMLLQHESHRTAEAGAAALMDGNQLRD